MVDPSAVPADDDHATLSALHHVVEGEVEVGGVLVCREAPDLGAAALGIGEHGGLDAVHVSDDDVDVETEGGCVLQPGVGGNDERAGREILRQCGVDVITAGEHDRVVAGWGI
jgi:hypothetical protein